MKPTQILEAVEACRKEDRAVTIQPYKAADRALNEYCLFLKPETLRSKNFSAILDLTFATLDKFGQTPRSGRVLPSSYIVKHKLMELHYGVIDAISRGAAKEISDEAREKLNHLIEKNGLSNPELLGGHEFLERYRCFNAESLAIMYDSLSNNRIAGGTHCVLMQVRGKPIILFNGFHPEQLENYTTAGSAILVFSIATDRAWESIRKEMTGATNPSRGADSSLRKQLLENKVKLGLDEVSAGRNGVHVSAGPVEGMIELVRFMSDRDSGEALKYEETAFGSFLLSKGMSRADLYALEKNPILRTQGKEGPIFDLTEEIDAKAACELLTGPKRK